MWKQSLLNVAIHVLTTVLFLHCAFSQNVVVTDGVCGESKGCFSSGSGCDETDPGSCAAFSSWIMRDGVLEVYLRAETATYIAIGFSKSGRMYDSDVYACTSNNEVVRSRNSPTDRASDTAELIGVTDVVVENVDGLLSCSFKREVSLPEGENDGGNFFDLSGGATYTPILAWDGPLENGAIGRHSGSDRVSGANPIDFAENSAAEAGSTLFLAKLHGCFMVLAWFGFASIGITTARFFKKALPGDLCGKPSWFAIHRACMVCVTSLTIIGYIVILIYSGGYLDLVQGPIPVTHAVTGTIVFTLSLVNVIMAAVRPHPGEPRRGLFNWAHWGVGVSAHLLAGVTVLLGVSNRLDQDENGGVLLPTVPPFVFWLAIALTFFHLFSWLILTVVDILRKKDSPNVSVHHHAGTDSTHASTNGMGNHEQEKEPVIKLVIYVVYFIVVVVLVATMVLAIGIANYQTQ